MCKSHIPVLCFLLISCGAGSTGGDGVLGDTTAYEQSADTQPEAADSTVDQIAETSDQIEETSDQESEIDTSEAEQSFNGLNFFGTQSDFKYAFYGNGSCDADDYVQKGLGGVIRSGVATYSLDLDNSGHLDSSKYRLYYSEDINCLLAAATNTSGDTFDKWVVFNGFTSYDDLATGTSLTKGDSVGDVSGDYSSSFLIDDIYYNKGTQFIHKGSNKYLKLTNTAGSLDNFMTSVGGNWAFGFTLKEDWNIGGGAPQMFVDASSSGSSGNFGLSFSNFYGMQSGHLVFSDDSGFSDDYLNISDSSELPVAGDSIIFHYDSIDAMVYVYFNNDRVGELDPSILPSSSATNRDFTWGKAKSLEATGVGEDNYDGFMPVAWSLKIKDLWISASGYITSSDIVDIVSAVEDNDDISSLASYDTTITHHWPLTDDLNAAKGGLDFSLESD